MDISQPVFLGLDLPALLTLPVILAMFGFAVWWGLTRAEVGIDAAEQARRNEAPRRS